MIFSTAAFALPRSAGALTRILRASPSQPAMPSREEDGTTLINNLIFQSPTMSCTIRWAICSKVGALPGPFHEAIWPCYLCGGAEIA